MDVRTSEAIVLAGGFGTRLRGVLGDIPKPMAPILGRPFLEYLLDRLVVQDFRHVVLSVGHLSEVITKHFGSAYRGMSIDYAVERQALGTGGGLALALESTSSETVFALNGDTMFDLDLRSMEKFSALNNPDALIALRKVEDGSRYGCIDIDEEGRIAAFREKGGSSGPGLINAGVYLLRRDIFSKMNLSGSFSMEKDCLEAGVSGLKLYGFESEAYFIDIGVPEDYRRASLEFDRYADH